ncbi:MAG: glycosyltransferase family 2 protein [Candidatus Methanofastidiosa archaeon]|nr:glycosyltransferase family 2 protein [Candidatus Methanofastidiosa archaeon]
MVDILLATYNGEKFLKEQIDSIINQSFNDWTLYIRDDGSKDTTLSIIKEYKLKYPKKIVLINDTKKSLGVKLNFLELIKYSKSKYCMFCDQDDVWDSNKVALTLDEMRRIEEECNQDVPILVHTNLRVVDANLKVISESFWKYSKIDARRNKLNNLLIKNTITGCTMMINSSLRKLIFNLPDGCIMHDWWIGILASCFGKMGVVYEPTISYRQHGNNEIGAISYTLIDRIKSKVGNPKSLIENFELEVIQAREILKIYQQDLNEDSIKIIKEFVNLKKSNFLLRRYKILKNGFLSDDIIKNIKILIFI